MDVFPCGVRYPYLNHLVLNAGAASFIAVDWFKFIVSFIVHPVITLTVASYIIQPVGERSNDGLGYIWQCNVFGPYIFVSSFTYTPHTPPIRPFQPIHIRFHQYRELQPLLGAFHSRSEVDHHYPSRVLWTSSLEATHFYRPEDWQLVETGHPYEASKYQIDILACQLEKQALQLEEQTNRPAEVRHMLIHPGVASTSIAENLVLPALAYFMSFGLLLVTPFFRRLWRI